MLLKCISYFQFSYSLEYLMWIYTETYPLQLKKPHEVFVDYENLKMLLDRTLLLDG